MKISLCFNKPKAIWPHTFKPMHFPNHSGIAKRLLMVRFGSWLLENITVNFSSDKYAFFVATEEAYKNFEVVKKTWLFIQELFVTKKGYICNFLSFPPSAVDVVFKVMFVNLAYSTPRVRSRASSYSFMCMVSTRFHLYANSGWHSTQRVVALCSSFFEYCFYYSCRHQEYYTTLQLLLCKKGKVAAKNSFYFYKQALFITAQIKSPHCTLYDFVIYAQKLGGCKKSCHLVNVCE